MFKLEKNSPGAETLSSGSKIRRLVFGRIALIFLLLLASWWWKSSYLQLTDEDFPAGLFLLFLFSVGLTVVYLTALRFDRRYQWQMRAQFFVDVFLITWIVWLTGDAISPYVTLYIILISVVGFFLGRGETLFYAVLCAVCFSGLSILSANSMIFSFSGDVPPSRLMQIIGFNNVAILIVGLLAARLAERRKVSERLRETEENFADLNLLQERILESIRSGLITTDLEGKIHSFNRAAEEISGRQAGEAIGQSVFSVFTGELRAPVEICLRAAEIDEFPTEHFEAGIRPPAGETTPPAVTVACSVAPLVGRRGKVYGLILTFQDMTKIRVMEETLRRSDRLTAVGRMAAGLAHEIRNPLGSMSAALQFLREKVPPATAEAELMEVVLRESDRLNRIITNFLTYARPSADIFAKTSFETTDVGEAIRDCMVLLRHSPEVKQNHSLEYELPSDPIRILANETQIKQVFWNLSKNSIQAMPEGGRLNVRVREYPGKNVQIVFEDTGSGINPQSLEHLFEPFSAGARGTGLGLSIVHKIVSDHGGRIDVQSQQEKGTKITVELPADVGF